MIGWIILFLLYFVIIIVGTVTMWKLTCYIQNEPKSSREIDLVQLQQMHDDAFLEIYNAMGTHAAAIIQKNASKKLVMKRRHPTIGMKCHGCSDLAPCNGELWWFESGSRGRVLCPFCYKKETK